MIEVCRNEYRVRFLPVFSSMFVFLTMCLKRRAITAIAVSRIERAGLSSLARPALSFKCDYQSLLDTQRECIERMLAHPEQFESWRQVWVAAELALLDTAEQLIC